MFINRNDLEIQVKLFAGTEAGRARKAHKVGLGSMFKTIRTIRTATGRMLLHCCEGLLLAGSSSAHGFECRNQQFGFIGLDDVGLVF